MTIFTPQERRVVLFLITSLLAGTSVKLYRNWRTADPVPTARGLVELPSVHDSASILELDTLIREVENRLSDETRKVTEKVVDLNSASESDLCLLPGIGPKLAHRIVDHRETHGKFKSARDLVRVPGIGEKKLAAIEQMVFAGESHEASDTPKGSIEGEADEP